MKPVAVVFQCFCFFYFNFVLLKGYRVGQAIENKYNIKIYWFRYLTHWAAFSQVFYFGLSLVIILLKKIPNCEQLRRRLRCGVNYLFITVAMPQAISVTLSFWGIYFLDRELIHPRNRDEFLPPWVNHSLHTLNVVAALIDMYLVKHDYTNHKTAIAGVVGFYFAYGSCIIGTYFETGKWLYPFLGVMSIPILIIYFTGMLMFNVLIYVFTVYLNSRFWGKEGSTKTKRAKPTKSKRA